MSEIINNSPRGVHGSESAHWSAEAEAHRRAVDARLDEACAQFGGCVPALGRAMTEAATAPGKRFRGVLMMMLGTRLGAVGPAVIDAACAVELVHTASLVIDDLPAMDGAALRRGRATTHVVHGEGRAILTGIALMSEAFRLLAAIDGVEGAIRAALVEALAEAVGPAGLCAGQDLDLHDDKTPASIAREQDLKTGQLFEAAFRIVAMLARCDAARMDRLAGVSRLMGRAFQSYDDLLDISPGAGRADKTAGRDRGAGGPHKGLLAVADPAAAVRHYGEMRRQLDDALTGLWFDARGLAAYVGTVLPPGALAAR